MSNEFKLSADVGDLEQSNKVTVDYNAPSIPLGSTKLRTCTVTVADVVIRALDVARSNS